jgi:hypothetical protein
MDWKCVSARRAPALQAEALSSNPSPTKKKKKKRKETDLKLGGSK